MEGIIKKFGKSIENLKVSSLCKCRISNVILLRDTATKLSSKQSFKEKVKIFLATLLKIRDEKIYTKLKEDEEKGPLIEKFDKFYYAYSQTIKYNPTNNPTLEGFKKYIADLFLIVRFLAKDQIAGYVNPESELKTQISKYIDIIVYYIRDKIMGSNDESPIGVLLRVVFTQNNLRSTTQGGKRKQTRKRKQSRKRKHSRKRKQ